MMDWSACGLSADTVSDQASWQAYIALTLSSIESAIRLPKKAILIIPDKVSRFTTKVYIDGFRGQILKQKMHKNLKKQAFMQKIITEQRFYTLSRYHGRGDKVTLLRFVIPTPFV